MVPDFKLTLAGDEKVSVPNHGEDVLAAAQALARPSKDTGSA